MRSIINYVLKMFPYMIGVIPAFIVIRVIFYKMNKKDKVNLKRELLMLIFFMFIIGLYSQAITGGKLKSRTPYYINLIFLLFFNVFQTIKFKKVYKDLIKIYLFGG